MHNISRQETNKGKNFYIKSPTKPTNKENREIKNENWVCKRKRHLRKCNSSKNAIDGSQDNIED